MCLLKILNMLPLVEPLEVLQRATENPVNLNQGDTSSQHHHTASSPHIQLSPGNSVNGILCPNTFTLPGCAHILNSNTQAFGRHTQCQDLLPPYQQRKKQPGPRQAPSMGSNTSTEQKPAPQLVQACLVVVFWAGEHCSFYPAQNYSKHKMSWLLLQFH